MNLEVNVVDLEKTLAEIKQIDTAKGRKIMTNYDDFIDKFQQVIKVKCVRELMQKALKYYTSENVFYEKDSLFSAYCGIKESKLSNADLKAANLQDYSTGNSLTMVRIEQRFTELGWKG